MTASRPDRKRKALSVVVPQIAQISSAARQMGPGWVGQSVVYDQEDLFLWPHGFASINVRVDG